MEAANQGAGNCKAVIYCRVSTEDQARGTSLESQEADCRAFAEQRGLEIVHVFKGEGESAKTIDRPAFQEMLKYCTASKGKIEAVIVWKLDRFSRDAGDANHEKARLAKIGVQVYSATEPALNEDNPAARLTFTMLAGVAQFDNEIRAERAVTGMKRRVQEGCWAWGAPFGYRNCPRGADRDRHREHGLIEPIPEVARVIKAAFQLAATGHHSQAGVFEELRKEGLTVVNGRNLHLRNLRNILRNPVYFGYMDAFGERRKGKWEPLVSVETFEAAQKVLNTQDFVKQQSHFYTYSGLVHCADCGGRLTPELQRGAHISGRYVYYSCAACRKRKTRPRFWKESEIDDVVAGNLKPLVIDQELADLVVEMLEQYQDEDHAEREIERASLLTERDRLLKRKKRALELYLDGKLSDEDYANIRAEISLRLPTIESKLAEFETDQASLIPTARKVLELSQRAPFLYVRQNLEEKRKFLDLVFSNLFLDRVTASVARSSPWDLIVNCRKKEEWRTREDSNLRHQDPESCALSRLSYGRATDNTLHTKELRTPVSLYGLGQSIAITFSQEILLKFSLSRRNSEVKVANICTAYKVFPPPVPHL